MANDLSAPTAAGTARTLKGFTTLGRREAAYKTTMHRLMKETGVMPTTIAIADAIYAEDPELLAPAARKAAKERAAK